MNNQPQSIDVLIDCSSGQCLAWLRDVPEKQYCADTPGESLLQLLTANGITWTWELQIKPELVNMDACTALAGVVPEFPPIPKPSLN